MQTLFTTSCVAVLVALISLGGCGGSDCEGDCECRGTECQCPSSGDCLIDCAADCDLSCTGSGNCDFLCGPSCLAQCPGSGDCLVDVGGASTVTCTGSGDCDVICGGDCEVDCPGSGRCTVTCADGALCTFGRCSGEVMSCPDSVQVCNGGCP